MMVVVVCDMSTGVWVQQRVRKFTSTQHDTWILMVSTCFMPLGSVHALHCILLFTSLFCFSFWQAWYTLWH